MLLTRRDDVFITGELLSRSLSQPDLAREKLAIQDLAASMVDDPDRVLPRFVELAMELTGGTSAGLSLLEERPAPGVFRWHNVCGALKAFEGATTPRHHSPCGVTLDEASPVLTRHAERIYAWISDASIVVPEVLLVPLYLGGKDPLGTLWIVSDEDGHFNGAHARCATELATFVGIALRMTRAESQLRQALDKQQTIAREMSHRVKNLFALANSMIRFGLKSARDKEDLAAGLSGRLHALASAHTLVLASEEDSAVTDLAALIRSIVEPHEMAGEGALSRFSLTGPTLACAASAVSGMALVFNELATNATKYGALTSEAGHVAIDWHQEGEDVVLRWTETGGAPIEAEPARHGFGTRLLDSTIVRQLKGTFTHDWLSGGVVVTITIPAGILAVQS
jgi:two-component sensor histidine kinase